MTYDMYNDSVPKTNYKCIHIRIHLLIIFQILCVAYYDRIKDEKKYFIMK